MSSKTASSSTARPHFDEGTKGTTEEDTATATASDAEEMPPAKILKDGGKADDGNSTDEKDVTAAEAEEKAAAGQEEDEEEEALPDDRGDDNDALDHNDDDRGGTDDGGTADIAAETGSDGHGNGATDTDEVWHAEAVSAGTSGEDPATERVRVRLAIGVTPSTRGRFPQVSTAVPRISRNR